jgi:N utilization substance protein A
MVAQADNSKGDRISLEELRFISLFQDITGAMVYRAIEDAESNRLFYLVDKNDLGKAIGKDGRNVKTLSKILNKNVEVIGYAPDLESMVRNLFPGISVLKVDVVDKGDGKVIYVKVKDDEKGKAIGKDGRNVKRARVVLLKLFNVDKVVIR